MLLFVADVKIFGKNKILFFIIGIMFNKNVLFLITGRMLSKNQASFSRINTILCNINKAKQYRNKNLLYLYNIL